MSHVMRLCAACLVLCLMATAGFALDPAAPARDNAPRIWRALTGEQVELDGKTYTLRGVKCPAPATDRGRRAKALLNTFLKGTRNSSRITCEIYGAGADASVSCIRNGRQAADVMIDSGLCHRKELAEDHATASNVLNLERHTSRGPSLSFWRLRSCIGVHPGLGPRQCRLASRTWPLRYAQAAQWLERQTVSVCPKGVRPKGPVFRPKAGRVPPSRYRLRPFLNTRCRSGYGGH